MEQCRGGCSHEMVNSPATAATMAYPTLEEEEEERRSSGDGHGNDHDDEQRRRHRHADANNDDANNLDPFPRRRAPSSNNATLYTTTTNRAPIVPITTTINTTTTTSLPLYLIVILRTATEPYPKSARVHPPNRAGPQRPSIAFHRSRAPRGSRTRGRGPGSRVNQER